MFTTNKRLTNIEDIILTRIPEQNKRIRELESELKELKKRFETLETSYNSLTHKVFIKGYPSKK